MAEAAVTAELQGEVQVTAELPGAQVVTAVPQEAAVTQGVAAEEDDSGVNTGLHCYNTITATR